MPQDNILTNAEPTQPTPLLDGEVPNLDITVPEVTEAPVETPEITPELQAGVLSPEIAQRDLPTSVRSTITQQLGSYTPTVQHVPYNLRPVTPVNQGWTVPDTIREQAIAGAQASLEGVNAPFAIQYPVDSPRYVAPSNVDINNLLTGNLQGNPSTVVPTPENRYGSSQTGRTDIVSRSTAPFGSSARLEALPTMSGTLRSFWNDNVAPNIEGADSIHGSYDPQMRRDPTRRVEPEPWWQGWLSATGTQIQSFTGEQLLGLRGEELQDYLGARVPNYTPGQVSSFISSVFPDVTEQDEILQIEEAYQPNFDPRRGYFGDYGVGVPGLILYTIGTVGSLGNVALYSATDAIARTYYGIRGETAPSMFERNRAYDTLFLGRDQGFTNVRDAANDRYLSTIPGNDDARWDEYGVGFVLGLGLDLMTGNIFDNVLRAGARQAARSSRLVNLSSGLSSISPRLFRNGAFTTVGELVEGARTFLPNRLGGLDMSVLAEASPGNRLLMREGEVPDLLAPLPDEVPPPDDLRIDPWTGEAIPRRQWESSDAFDLPDADALSDPWNTPNYPTPTIYQGGAPVSPILLPEVAATGENATILNPGSYFVAEDVPRSTTSFVYTIEGRPSIEVMTTTRPVERTLTRGVNYIVVDRNNLRFSVHLGDGSATRYPVAESLEELYETLDEIQAQGFRDAPLVEVTSDGTVERIAERLDPETIPLEQADTVPVEPLDEAVEATARTEVTDETFADAREVEAVRADIPGATLDEAGESRQTFRVPVDEQPSPSLAERAWAERPSVRVEPDEFLRDPVRVADEVAQTVEDVTPPRAAEVVDEVPPPRVVPSNTFYALPRDVTLFQQFVDAEGQHITRVVLDTGEEIAEAINPAEGFRKYQVPIQRGQLPPTLRDYWANGVEEIVDESVGRVQRLINNEDAAFTPAGDFVSINPSAVDEALPAVPASTFAPSIPPSEQVTRVLDATDDVPAGVVHSTVKRSNRDLTRLAAFFTNPDTGRPFVKPGRSRPLSSREIDRLNTYYPGVFSRMGREVPQVLDDDIVRVLVGEDTSRLVQRPTTQLPAGAESADDGLASMVSQYSDVPTENMFELFMDELKEELRDAYDEIEAGRYDSVEETPQYQDAINNNRPDSLRVPQPTEETRAATRVYTEAEADFFNAGEALAEMEAEVGRLGDEYTQVQAAIEASPFRPVDINVEVSNRMHHGIDNPAQLPQGKVGELARYPETVPFRGFGTDPINQELDGMWYHGSSTEIDDLNRINPYTSNTINEFGAGTYFTRQPQRAALYANVPANDGTLRTPAVRTAQRGTVRSGRLALPINRGVLSLAEAGTKEVRRIFATVADEVFGRDFGRVFSQELGRGARSGRARPARDYWTMVREVFQRERSLAISELDMMQFNAKVAERLRDELDIAYLSDEATDTVVSILNVSRQPIGEFQPFQYFNQMRNRTLPSQSVVQIQQARVRARQLLSQAFPNNEWMRFQELLANRAFITQLVDELLPQYRSLSNDLDDAVRRVGEAEDAVREIAQNQRRENLFISIRQGAENAVHQTRKWFDEITDSPCV